MTTNDTDAIRQRPSYADMVAAIRTEFPPMALEALWIQMREHRYNTSSLGVLAQAVHDAHDPAYDVPDARAELDRVRADLAAAHNHAHRQDTNLQQIARAKDEIAGERDRMKPVVEAAKRWAECCDRVIDDTRQRENALYDAVKALPKKAEVSR